MQQGCTGIQSFCTAPHPKSNMGMQQAKKGKPQTNAERLHTTFLPLHRSTQIAMDHLNQPVQKDCTTNPETCSWNQR